MAPILNRSSYLSRAVQRCVGTAVSVSTACMCAFALASGAVNDDSIGKRGAAPTWATVLEAAPDASVVTDPALRSAIIATGLPWRVKDTATNIEFVLIPPGSFTMGCSASTGDADTGRADPASPADAASPAADDAGLADPASPPKPTCKSPSTNTAHDVTISRAFYMGRYEVTQAQWQAKMVYNPSAFYKDARAADQPVEQVSWDVIQSFLAATGMRLPTEAEWEYAYRAGTTTAFHSMPGFPNGTDLESELPVIAWSHDGITMGEPQPVGQKSGNGYGLHDMSGNVFEWVSDWHDNAYYATSPAIDPTGPTTGSRRVIRGGSFAFGAKRCTAFDRGCTRPDLSDCYFGFRVVREP